MFFVNLLENNYSKKRGIPKIFNFRQTSLFQKPPNFSNKRMSWSNFKIVWRSFDDNNAIKDDESAKSKASVADEIPDCIPIDEPLAVFPCVEFDRERFGENRGRISLKVCKDNNLKKEVCEDLEVENGTIDFSEDVSQLGWFYKAKITRKKPLEVVSTDERYVRTLYIEWEDDEYYRSCDLRSTKHTFVLLAQPTEEKLHTRAPPCLKRRRVDCLKKIIPKDMAAGRYRGMRVPLRKKGSNIVVPNPWLFSFGK